MLVDFSVSRHCRDGLFRPDSGKRVGVRVLYFNRLGRGEIWLLLIYAKSERETIPAHVLKAIKEEIEDADD